MGGTPALFGWRPTRRWHMKRQQRLDGPAMMRDSRGHGRCLYSTSHPDCRMGVTQTLMRGTEVVDCSNQIHTMPQGQGVACQGPTSAGQYCQAFSECRIQPLAIRRVDHPIALRAPPQGLDTRRRAIDDAAFDLDYAPLCIAL